MSRPRGCRIRVSRTFDAGVIVRLRELRDGESFVTLLSRMEGLVIERHSDGVLVDLARGGEHSTRRLHPNVRVAAS